MMKKSELNPLKNVNERRRVNCPGCHQVKEHHAKEMCSTCYKKFSWQAKKIICKNCNRQRPHKAFGLCAGCHTRLHHYEKTLRFNAKRYHNIDYDKYKEITKECVSCGFSKIVQLHHLDGNSKNNKKDNMIGLCPNCHKMIHTYEFFEEIKQDLKKKGYDVRNLHPTNYIKP